ncbi:MAG: PPOX class F420-dependent oxidoreductase [Streptosporangiaceae bacterium]|nr:PPOX class F420-dependent oxidoreductase [Streptosporangiaceae bacterium]
MKLTEAEQRFLSAQRHGRLATIAPDGTPQVKPVGFSYNTELGTIDIAGMNMARSAKYRNIRSNPNVAFVADDVPAPERGAAGVRFLEIRGAAEAVTAPPAPGQPQADGHLAPEIIRIHVRRVLAFNVDPDRPGLQARDAGGDAVHSARWPE